MRVFQKSVYVLFGLMLVSGSLSSYAIDRVKITKDLDRLSFSVDGKSYEIFRNQNQENKLTGGFAKTSRKCPPFCVQPEKVHAAVVTVGELELLEFIKNYVATGAGVLVDARTPSWYKKGTIPGSKNIPFTVFSASTGDSKFVKALFTLGVRTGRSHNYTGSRHFAVDEFGAKQVLLNYDFSRAKEVALFCNGSWCEQSPRAIKALLAIGYPASKIHYYRGGMQNWLLLGLNTVVPK
jgi:rhodanese-related sulfurtransferase